MNKRYLFLDFDGVLHTDTPPRDLRHASHLLPIVARLELKIVVSSTWREAYPLQEIVGRLGALGRFVVGKTPVWSTLEEDVPDVGVRQLEIEAWLQKKAAPATPWVALDDEADNFRPSCKRVFLTDRRVGLDAQAAAAFSDWCTKLFSQK
jgi:hypothetical protein